MPPSTSEKMEVDKKPEEKKEPEVAKDTNAIYFENIREHIASIEKGESHILGRVLQVLHKTRKQLNPEVLHRLLALQPASLRKEELLSWLPPSSLPVTTESSAMEVDQSAKTPNAKSPRIARKQQTPPETEAYVHLLVLLYLVDSGKLDSAQAAAESLIRRVDQLDKRNLDPIAAKGYFYLAFVHERLGKLDELRSYLNSRLREATLRRHTESQATLIYTLLRAYLVGKHYTSASKLVSKVTFPEGANNNDLARFLYYQGRIKAMELDYTAAAGYFLQAIRKAPQEAAIGFKQNVQKWIVVVGLLQGEIAERSVFRQPIYRKCLAPYLELTQAVRLGDLVKFNATLDKYGKTIFEKDETITLIVRLRQNVIKTAVRQISLAYSRISIADIRKKLGLAGDAETEYMVAKAIADGSIDAFVTCVDDGKEAGTRFMQSAEVNDIYRTSEPQQHFDSRIRYCLELHNQAVKALRFPPKKAEEVESIEQQREREQQELEFAKGMAEEDDDDF